MIGWNSRKGFRKRSQVVRHQPNPIYLIMFPKTLAIIGTAGRGDDAKKLTIDHWNEMVKVAEEIAKFEKATDLVSGGAAWADHVAVQLYFNKDIPLKLFLPANEDDLMTAQNYHAHFSMAIGRNTWKEVMGLKYESYGRFKDRNSKVAKFGNVFLAMTFGDGAVVKDGGTKDTVEKMLKRDINGYHLDLNTMKLYGL